MNSYGDIAHCYKRLKLAQLLGQLSWRLSHLVVVVPCPDLPGLALAIHRPDPLGGEVEDVAVAGYRHVLPICKGLTRST